MRSSPIPVLPATSKGYSTVSKEDWGLVTLPISGDPSCFDIDAGGAIHDAVMIKIPRKGENNG